MSRLSVILPIINNTAWKESLDSILSGKEQDIEVLCVGKAFDDPAADAHVKYIQSDPAADLIGTVIPFINSQYIYFADPDTAVSADLFSSALQSIQNFNADLIIFSGEEYDQDKDKTTSQALKVPASKNMDGFFSSNELGKKLLQAAPPLLYNRIFKAELLKNPLLRENGHPLYISSMLAFLAERIAYIKTSLYTRSILCQPDEYSFNCEYYSKRIEAMDKLYDVLKGQGCNDSIMLSYAVFAVAELNQAVITPDRHDRRMELYNNLNDYLEKTGVLYYPDKEYPDQKAWKRLKGVTFILKAKALVERKENVPECSLVHAAQPHAEPAVSVIIPIYNVEAYLQECLDSVCSQTLQEIEIICVDDGSTDGSLDIACRAADKDDRVSVYTQKNAGQSAARNTGVSKARGEYLYFIDSDDRIEQGALKTLIERARTDNLDLLLFDGISFSEDDSLEKMMNHYRYFYLRKNDYQGVLTGPEMFCRMKENGEYRVQPCMQLIRREFFMNADLWFPHGILHEDNAFAFKVFLAADRVGYMPYAFYQRRLRADSVMTSENSFSNVFGYFYTCKDMSEALGNVSETQEKNAFIHELYYTMTVLRRRHRSLDIDEQLSYLVFSDTDRRQFELMVADIERVRASELNYKARLKKTEGERNKYRDSLDKEKEMNDALNERNRSLLAKITAIGDSKAYRIGQKAKKIKNVFKGRH